MTTKKEAPVDLSPEVTEAIAARMISRVAEISADLASGLQSSRDHVNGVRDSLSEELQSLGDAIMNLEVKLQKVDPSLEHVEIRRTVQEIALLCRRQAVRVQHLRSDFDMLEAKFLSLSDSEARENDAETSH